MSKVCRFYLNGTCNFGSSCRFLHTDPQYNDQYYNDSKPRYNNNNRGQYSEDYYSQINNNSDRGYHRGYNQYKYQPESKNKYFSSKNDYYQQNKEYNYSSSENTNYTRRQHKDTNEYNVKSDDDYDSKNYNISYIRKHFRDNDGLDNQSNNGNIQKFFTNFKADSNSNGYTDSMSKFDKNVGDNIRQKEKLLKVYQKEIKIYQSHVKGQLESNLWPFTCYQPIGKTFPVQPIGSLNFIEISFEELRCDYYLIKTMCANPELIHGKVFQDLVLKARNQKKDILSLNNNVEDDILATFEKCEQSKTELTFQNSILPDENSYWDMSIKRLKTPEANKSELESFSFSTKVKEKPGTQNIPPLKILMQTDVYGKMDCDAFAEDSFTDYIPIIPPPKNRCV